MKKLFSTLLTSNEDLNHLTLSEFGEPDLQSLVNKKRGQRKFKENDLILDGLESSPKFEYKSPTSSEKFSNSKLKSLEEQLSPKTFIEQRLVKSPKSSDPKYKRFESLDHLVNHDGLSLFGLPIYIHVLIFSYLDPLDLNHMIMVNSIFLEVGLNDQLWQFLCKKYLNVTKECENYKTVIWRQTFVENFKKCKS